MLCVHRLREGVKVGRTTCINRIRLLLLEFGVAVPNGVRAFSATPDDILEDASSELNGVARMTLHRAQAQWRELDAHIDWCDERLAAHEQGNSDVKRAAH